MTHLGLTQEQFDAMVVKANKWDALDEAIGKFYPYFDDDGLVPNDYDEDDFQLGNIGEIAARAFGYIM